VSVRPTRHLELADLGGADEVVLRDHMNAEYDRGSDLEAIARLGDWLADREDGWYVPREGVEVVTAQLTFYAAGRILGSVGLGPDHLVAQRQGGFGQRDAEPGDRAAALAILGFDDPDA
jgi:hypothetical protein